MSYYQTIYNCFRKAGMTQAGALAMLGNFECESNCEPNRVQGDGDRYRTISKAYTQNYSNGSWGRDRFVNGKTGYGLAQWTFPARQGALWDYWKQSGKALDDPAMQCNFAVKELKHDYPELWKLLCTSNDLYTLTKRVCYDFENPAIKNVDARYQAANRIKNMIDLSAKATPEPTPDPVKDDSLKLRTIDGHCESFGEFLLLKGILLCRGYTCLNIWADVKEFQKRHGLTPDGIVGNLTWNKLLER